MRTIEDARRKLMSRCRCELINAMRRREVDCAFIAKRIRRHKKTIRAQVFGIDPLSLRTIAEVALALDAEINWKLIKDDAEAPATEAK